MFGIDQLQGNWKYNLQSIFDNDDNDSPFYNIKNSPYYESENFFNFLGEGKFSIISMNVRSLPGKWDKICNFLGDGISKGKKADFITFQEIWNIPPNTNCKIDGYHSLLYKTRDPTGLNANSRGGGRYLNK